MIRELVPGLLHWTAYRETIGMEVSSYFAVEAGALIDPMVPPEGVEAVREHGDPRVALLTNRHHLRNAADFGVPIRCHEAGLYEFAGRAVDVEGFAWGDEVAPGVQALEMGAICPEETCLRVDVGSGALAFADGLTHYGELGFVPDDLLGEDPEGVKEGLRRSLRRLVDEEQFDILLFAHGEPIVEGGHTALERFLG